jgi:hypothetical protein
VTNEQRRPTDILRTSPATTTTTTTLFLGSDLRTEYNHSIGRNKDIYIQKEAKNVISEFLLLFLHVS